MLNTIKLLLKENLLKNTPNKEGDLHYLVSGNNCTAVTSDTNDTESTSLPKLRETFTQNAKGHGSSGETMNGMLHAEFFTLKTLNSVIGEISNLNKKISEMF